MNNANQALVSKSLKLRQWREEDFASFAKINADPRVMAFFPNRLTKQQSDQLANRVKSLISKNGYGFWALELLETGTFIGFVGLNPISTDSGIPHAPMMEIGWRIDADYWGKGYAPEAAQLALNFAFNQLKLDAVYSFTSVLNIPSQRVMQKIGMKNTEQNFEHPALADGHKLKTHCLYKMTGNEFSCLNSKNMDVVT